MKTVLKNLIIKGGDIKKNISSFYILTSTLKGGTIDLDKKGRRENETII